MDKDEQIARVAAQTFMEVLSLETADTDLVLAAMDIVANDDYESPWPCVVARTFSMNEPKNQDVLVVVNTANLQVKVLDRAGAGWTIRD